MNDTFVVQLGDESIVVPRECPHRGGLLSCGTVNQTRGTITCPLHFSVFDLRSGRQISGPACPNLAVRMASGTSATPAALPVGN